MMSIDFYIYAMYGTHVQVWAVQVYTHDHTHYTLLMTPDRGRDQGLGMGN